MAKHDKRWLPLVILGCILVTNIIFGVVYLTHKEVFPIRIISRQVEALVERQPDGTAWPTIHVTSEEAWPTVILDSETCSTADVTANADLVFKNTDPAGFSESRGNTFTQLSKGCFSSQSQLQILDESRVGIREQARAGNKRTKWTINGVVAALNEDGTTGKFITWTSNEFVIVYDV